MANTFYGYWTCDYCGEENRGDQRECHACGKNRGKDVKFYPRPKKTQAEREYVENYQGGGPDWLCSYCDSLNPSSETLCKNCGHTREESDRNYFELHAEREEAKREEEDFMADDTPAEAPAPQPQPVPTRSGGGRGRWLILILLAALIGFMVFNMMPKERNLTITAKNWERSVAVEHLNTVREEDWSVPAGGRMVGSYRAVHHYQQVLDHYETVQRSRQVPNGGHNEVTGYRDNGDGTFSEVTTWVTDYTTEYYTEQEPVYRSEPVYATKYQYDIERWQFDHNEVTQGGDDEPYFANIDRSEKVRANGSNEKYTVTGTYEAKKGQTTEGTWTVSYDDWTSLRVGQSIKAKIHYGNQLEIEK